VVVIILPLLSGMADYSGQKKFFMKLFVLVGSVACSGLFFFEDVGNLGWGIACSVFASIGYSGSLVFYDAFLPEIVSADRYDATSARGYSMGYFGSIILMIVCLAMILKPQAFGFASEGAATRFSFLLTGIWWLGFSFIPFTVLQDRPAHGPNQKSRLGQLWVKGYQEIRQVWRQLGHQPSLKRYLLAFFFFNMGVQTIMYLATLFGTDVLRLPDANLIMTVLLIQLVGAAGAWIFARVSMRVGNKKALLIMISIWISVCVAAYFIEAAFQFYALAFVVGMVMGGIQSISRATYAKLIPTATSDHASYFSFYDVTYNLSIVLGTFSYGFVNQVTGSMRNSALALGLFFVVGILFLLRVRDERIERAAA